MDTNEVPMEFVFEGDLPGTDIFKFGEITILSQGTQFVFLANCDKNIVRVEPVIA